MEVILHVEQIFSRLPIYHVGVTYKCGFVSKRYDFHPKRYAIGIRGKRKSIKVGRCNKTPFDIINYEQSLNKHYVLLFNDCRHYTKQMIDYSCSEHINTTNLLSLHQLFNSV